MTNITKYGVSFASKHFCIHGKKLNDWCDACLQTDLESSPKKPRRKINVPPKNPNKGTKGTKGRGRPQTTGPVNERTQKAFMAAMAADAGQLSLRQWAIAADIKYGTMIDYARGRYAPSLKVAAKIAAAGNVTMDFLFGHLAED